MLQPGDQVPHFEVTTLEGRPVSYSTIWQRRNLVLITAPSSDPDGAFARYVSGLIAQLPASARHDAEWVITRDAVTGIPCPGVAIADRWGEIVTIASRVQGGELPRADELVDWIDYLQHQCPECEGEAK